VCFGHECVCVSFDMRVCVYVLDMSVYMCVCFGYECVHVCACMFWI